MRSTVTSNDMHVLLKAVSSDVMLVTAIKLIQEVGPKLATLTPAFS